MKSQSNFRFHPRKFYRVLLLTLATTAIGSGVYLLLLLTAPIAPSLPFSQPTWNKPVPHTVLREQQIYIPRLQLNLLYGDNKNALNDGLWHRFPERGDPEKGGNFILAGHRFEIGFTPGATRRKSPLYHLDEVQAGDYIYVDFNGHRYQYEVSRRYKVKPAQTEIEAPSTEAKMTLYTCTIQGQADGREVLEAKLIQKNVNPDAELLLRL